MNNDIVKQALLEAYEKRLKSVLTEVSIVDEQGNIVITKGLKVRDKKSGYEYTVEKVKDEGKSMCVVLRSPNSPRFRTGSQNVDVYTPANQQKKQSGALVVTKDDFEKNFEVE